MTYDFPRDLRELVNAHLVTGDYASEDHVLRAAFRALDNEDDDVAAVRAAIQQWRDGDARLSVDEAFDEVRRRLDC